jgi:predicted MPP superfamily phosphohydrolase
MNKFINSEKLNRLNRRDFLKLSAFSLLGASLAGLGINYATNVEPSDVEITNISLKLPRLDRSFNGFRLAQISDLHLDNWMTLQRLEPLFQLVLAQKPDLVAITGDFITYHTHTRGLKNPYLTDLASALNILSPHQPTLAVLGNHDHEIGAPLIHDALVAGHLTDLSNSVITINQSASSLHFAGIDYNPEGIFDYSTLINNIPSAGAAIMLVHYPDLADQTASTGRFDLQISGHSHGGQVIFPWIGPIYTPEGARKYPIGLYKIGSLMQYTNRGLGMVGVQVRINCRPEITIYHLQSS